MPVCCNFHTKVGMMFRFSSQYADRPTIGCPPKQVIHKKKVYICEIIKYNDANFVHKFLFLSLIS
ncbi:hypothetical protein VCHA42O253_80014 [Vibrio chagasii]|nr:hypothetical protein VCHA42O253_80014 [Vibrio chagasii]